jgi:hypothetical protein
LCPFDLHLDGEISKSWQNRHCGLVAAVIQLDHVADLARGVERGRARLTQGGFMRPHLLERRDIARVEYVDGL